MAAVTRHRSHQCGKRRTPRCLSRADGQWLCLNRARCWSQVAK